jgi:hypothetical protein
MAVMRDAACGPDTPAHHAENIRFGDDGPVYHWART